jgi:hypothetical protein
MRSEGSEQVQGDQYGKQAQALFWSAPPKICFNRRSQTKLMADAQKAISVPNDDGEIDKVHIPDTFEDSDTDSDSFIRKIKQLTNEDVGQSSKEGQGDSSKQVWFIQTDLNMVKDNEIGFSMDPMGKNDVLCEEKELLSGEKRHMGKVQSPEIFMTDDNIVNTQDSVQEEENNQIIKDSRLSEQNVNGFDTGVVSEPKVYQIPERRRSERLKKDTGLTTMEKLEKAGAKKNLEGNSKTTNSFSILSVDDIIHTTADMGIVVDSNNFATFDLINELENARNDLYHKQNEQKMKSQTDAVEIEKKVEGQVFELDWLHEESSETEDFILVESRKKKRENRKKLKISPLKQGTNQDQEVPGLIKKKGRKPCNAPVPKNTRIHKKS